MNRFNFATGIRGLLIMLALGLTEPTLRASFEYAPGDLLMGLRKTGAASDITANLGQVTNYLGLPPGTTVTVTNLLTNQLATAFTDLGGTAWSIFSTVRTNGNPNYPGETLWVTAPRIDVAVQSDPWVRKSRITQGNTESIIYAIGNGAFLYGNSEPAGPDNASTGILIPSGDPLAYGSLMTPGGNFRATFQGNAENTNPDNFSTSGLSARSDLYELQPGSLADDSLNTPGTFVGYFDFKPDGALIFTAAGGQPPPPQAMITAVTRNGNASTISFTTVSGATYTLRHTNSAGLATPVTSWTAGAESVTGDGSVWSLQDGSTDTDRFYVVAATPGPPGSQPSPGLARPFLVNSR